MPRHAFEPISTIVTVISFACFPLLMGQQQCPPVPPSVQTFQINNGAEEATSPVVTLDNVCTGEPTAYMASESPDFAGASWIEYSTSPPFTLAGAGTKTVYFKVRNAEGVESIIASDSITLKGSESGGWFEGTWVGTELDPLQQASWPTVQVVNSGTAVGYVREGVVRTSFTLDESFSPAHCDVMITGWEPASSYYASHSGQISLGIVDLEDDTLKMASTAPGDPVRPESFEPICNSERCVRVFVAQRYNGLDAIVASFSIYRWADRTTRRAVTLDNVCLGDPTQYVASESPGFGGASWQTYSTSPSFTLSTGNGTKTVYFKVKNGAGESQPATDTIVASIGP